MRAARVHRHERFYLQELLLIARCQTRRVHMAKREHGGWYLTLATMRWFTLRVRVSRAYMLQQAEARGWLLHPFREGYVVWPRATSRGEARTP